MNFYLVLYISSFVMAMNADDWFLIWLALEVNMMVFVIMVYERYSLKHIESCLKYFFVQSLGSAVFVSVFYMNKEYLMCFGGMIMSYKVGAGPFFFWFPSVAQGFGWLSCLLLFSFQKIIPLMLMMLFIGWMVWMILIVSLIFGVFGSFNQVHMKRLLAFSSIHHVGWLLMCGVVDSSVWCMYLFMYMLVIAVVIIIMSYFEIENLMGVMSYKGKWWFLMSMLSMGGMPPMLGFFLSWIAFYYFLSMNYWIVVFMILMSVVMFYVYVRVVYNVIMGMGDEMVWLNVFDKGFFTKIDVIGLVGMVVGSLLGIMILM